TNLDPFKKHTDEELWEALKLTHMDTYVSFLTGLLDYKKTIKEQFADCTVLTIAHRLHSVIDSDRLMVLDSGKIAEFQEPQSLLKDSNSVFYSMALDAGLVTE
ncbi:hypothetical protein FO519_010924, partial [Halicephalobus sp. NKZ332]